MVITTVIVSQAAHLTFLGLNLSKKLKKGCILILEYIPVIKKSMSEAYQTAQRETMWMRINSYTHPNL